MAIREHELDEVVGRVRVDRRTKHLLQRVQPGEIAVIDHEDLDRIAAEGLVAAGVARRRQRQRLVHRSVPERRPARGGRRRHPAASTTSART